MLRALPGNRETPTMKDQSAAQSAVWPGGKSIAVLVSVLFETWSDGKPELLPAHDAPEAGHDRPRRLPGAQYGGTQGLWRIRARLIATRPPPRIFCSGRCGELYPEVIAAAAKAGHDIAGHGYTQDGLFCYMTPDEAPCDPQDA